MQAKAQGLIFQENRRVKKYLWYRKHLDVPAHTQKTQWLISRQISTLQSQSNLPSTAHQVVNGHFRTILPATLGVAAQRITSVAWKRSVGGIVRPRAFAVLRLITSSNVIACSTGISAGLAPFSILSRRTGAWDSLCCAS